jgi:hypothetical protein
VVLMAFASSLQAQKGKPFEPECVELPFEDIKSQNLTVDAKCGVIGTAKKSMPSAKQNEAKNNFCAQGTPIVLSFADFDKLQKRAEEKHIQFGGKNLPSDRKLLRNLVTLANGTKIGEDEVVTLEGYAVCAWRQCGFSCR